MLQNLFSEFFICKPPDFFQENIFRLLKRNKFWIQQKCFELMHQPYIYLLCYCFVRIFMLMKTIFSYCQWCKKIEQPRWCSGSGTFRSMSWTWRLLRGCRAMRQVLWVFGRADNGKTMPRWDGVQRLQHRIREMRSALQYRLFR